MRPISPDRDRQPVFQRGPQFFEENGETMFVYRMDPSSQIGPIPAEQSHMDKHYEAYQAFLAAKDADAVARVAPAGGEEDEWHEPVKRGPGRPRKHVEAAA